MAVLVVKAYKPSGKFYSDEETEIQVNSYEDVFRLEKLIKANDPTIHCYSGLKDGFSSQFNYVVELRDSDFFMNFTLCEAKTGFSPELSRRIALTDEYSRVCSSCRDDILLYPGISGRTSYTQEEVEEYTVFRILNSLDEYKGDCKKYKQALEDILLITANALCTAPMKCFENQDCGTDDVSGCNPNDTYGVTNCPLHLGTVIYNKAANALERSK